LDAGDGRKGWLVTGASAALALGRGHLAHVRQRGNILQPHDTRLVQQGIAVLAVFQPIERQFALDLETAVGVLNRL
jgi:hypothetical protein